MKLPRSNDELVSHMKKHGMVKTPAIIEAFRAVDRGDFATPSLGQVNCSVFFSLFVFEVVFLKSCRAITATVSPLDRRLFPTRRLAQEMLRGAWLRHLLVRLPPTLLALATASLVQGWRNSTKDDENCCWWR